MTSCPWCGAGCLPADRYCSRCGSAVGGSLPPRPPNPSVLPVIVVIVVVIVATLAAVVIWGASPGLCTGCQSSPKPLVTLTASRTSTGADVLVAGMSLELDPSNYLVNIENLSSAVFGEAVAMPTTSNRSVFLTVGAGATLTVFSVTWVNAMGSGLVSPGDHFLITRTFGTYSRGTTFAFWLIWKDGSTLTWTPWTV